jgi:glycosyltransferase involved in cell wall biosynthesis
LSNTILEAMAAGLPVVATHVGGADEMVLDGLTGILVPPGSPRALAEALASMMRDLDARRAMGVAGRERAHAEFGLDAMVRRYEELYLELALHKCGTSVTFRREGEKPRMRIAMHGFVSPAWSRC